MTSQAIERGRRRRRRRRERRRPGLFARLDPRGWLRGLRRPSAGFFGYSVLALLVVWLAWQVLLATGGQAVPEGELGEPPSWAATNAPQLVRLAERHLSERAGETVNWRPVERAAREALAHSPLEGRALVLLAMASRGRGDEAEAERLMELAGSRSLRDSRVHLWLVQQRLDAGDYDEALYHADIVLRMGRGTQRSRLRPALMAMAQHPPSLSILIAKLAEHPPWRGWLLRELGQNDPPAALPVLLALEAAGEGPSESELRRQLDRLIANGRYGEAYLLWRRFLPEERSADARYLHNGDFTWPISNIPFDWIIDPPRGAEIAIIESEGRQRLRLDFARGRLAFRHISKLLTLPPGTYRLSGAAEARQFGNERGLQWRLRCAGGEEIVATERLSGTAEHHFFAVEFTLPAADCQAQWLRLELASRAAREADIEGGTVWYDSLELERIAAP